MKTWPELGSSSPEMVRSRVDLPQPEGPTKTTNSPSPTSRSTLWMTATWPKLLLMPRSCNSAMHFPLQRLPAACDARRSGLCAYVCRTKLRRQQPPRTPDMSALLAYLEAAAMKDLRHVPLD